MSIAYDLFARKDHPEPLAYIGSIEIEDPTELARVSLEKYGPETRWIELVAVPQQEVIMVFSEHAEGNL